MEKLKAFAARAGRPRLDARIDITPLVDMAGESFGIRYMLTCKS